MYGEKTAVLTQVKRKAKFKKAVKATRLIYETIAIAVSHNE